MSAPRWLWLCPLVGMHFRPGGKQITALLGSGQALVLVRDAENPYDPHAIKVGVQGSTIPAEVQVELGVALEGTGVDPEEVMSSPFWWLGFLASTSNKVLASHPEWSGNAGIAQGLDEGASYSASLQFSPEVSPLVAINAGAQV